MTDKFAFMVAGTHSGCGKTTLTLALLASLRARGLDVQPFKVGPDFIDPGFHHVVSGRESRNLDGWMLGLRYNQELFQQRLKLAHGAVVEGVMGLFDGFDGSREWGSSAEMAKWLNIPVLLVVDARSMARSAAALVQGFQNFDGDLSFAGVLFNRVGSVGHLRYLEEALESVEGSMPVLGGIPREAEVALPERHLGLVTAHETVLTEDWMRKLTALMEDHVALDELLKRCAWKGLLDVAPERAGAPSWDEREKASPFELLQVQSRCTSSKIPVAVARDAAFCFYYPDNLELLESFGAQIQFFSPLAGETVPPSACGVYLGGGYPELYARELSGQKGFLEALRSGAARGMPIYAECGGLMVLGRFIETLERTTHSMAGLLPFGTRMLPRRKALGYTEVLLREPCLLGDPGMVMRGHEFHYSEIVDSGERAPVQKVYELRKRKHASPRMEGYAVGSVLASYIHLHWGSAPRAAESFVARCRAFRHRQ